MVGWCRSITEVKPLLIISNSKSIKKCINTAMVLKRVETLPMLTLMTNTPSQKAAKSSFSHFFSHSLKMTESVKWRNIKRFSQQHYFSSSFTSECPGISAKLVQPVFPPQPGSTLVMAAVTHQDILHQPVT